MSAWQVFGLCVLCWSIGAVISTVYWIRRYERLAMKYIKLCANCGIPLEQCQRDLGVK